MRSKKINILLLLLFILFPLLSSSSASAQVVITDWEYAVDQCALVDHWWEPSTYPALDTSSPIFSGSLTLGGIGITFNLDYVEAGSTWIVNFDDQFSLETTIPEDGRAFVYYGLWSYGDYWFTSTLLSPSSESMEGPSGTVHVDESENLECSQQHLSPYVIPPTVTPALTPTTAFTAPTVTPISETVVEEPAVILENDQVNDLMDEDLSPFQSFYNFIISSIYLLCFCIFIIALVLLGIVVIVIRRRKPDLYDRLRRRFRR